MMNCGSAHAHGAGRNHDSEPEQKVLDIAAFRKTEGQGLECSLYELMTSESRGASPLYARDISSLVAERDDFALDRPQPFSPEQLRATYFDILPPLNRRGPSPWRLARNTLAGAAALALCLAPFVLFATLL